MSLCPHVPQLDDSHAAPEPGMPFCEGEIHRIREVIRSFQKRCNLSWPIVKYDYDFEAACVEEAIRRGYPMDGPKSLAPFIPGGVTIATTAYAHLKDRSTQIFISLFTSALIYLDDIFQYNVDAVKEFNQRFVMQKSQANAVLDSLASLLLELNDHFSGIVSNLIVTSTLNLVTALLVEYETQGMALRKGAHGYPDFSRVKTGASEAYGLFVFPPALPLPIFIQAIPEIMIYIDDVNDVLSFYKEELSGESVNRISLLANLHGISKHEVLCYLADDAAAAHERVIQILKAQPAALDAYTSFASGFLEFHARLPRYRLFELELQD